MGNQTLVRFFFKYSEGGKLRQHQVYFNGAVVATRKLARRK